MKEIIEDMPLCRCDHGSADHGDRAIFPVCEGGWQGQSQIGQKRVCPCQGYRPGELRRRRWMAA